MLLLDDAAWLRERLSVRRRLLLWTPADADAATFASDGAGRFFFFALLRRCLSIMVVDETRERVL